MLDDCRFQTSRRGEALAYVGVQKVLCVNADVYASSSHDVVPSRSVPDCRSAVALCAALKLRNTIWARHPNKLCITAILLAASVEGCKLVTQPL